MKFSDYIFLSSKTTLKKNKAFKKMIRILSFIFFIIISGFFVQSTVKKTLEENFKYNSAYRSIFVVNTFYEEENTLINKLKQIPHISHVFSSDEVLGAVDISGDNINKNSFLFLEPGENGLAPNVKSGRKLNDKGEKELICPDKIVFDSNLDTNFHLSAKDYFKAKRILDKEIEVKYYSYDYTLEIPKINKVYTEKYKVVGLFDSDVYGHYNTCYTNSDNIKKINSADKTKNYGIESDSALLAVVDTLENVDKVKNILEKSGYEYLMSAYIDEELFKFVEIITNSLCIIFILFAIIEIYIFTKKILTDEYRNIIIYKALGYSLKNVMILIFLEILILIFISFFVSLFMFSFIYLLLSYIINFQFIVLKVFRISYPFIKIFIFLVIISIIGFISTITFMNKHKNDEIIRYIC